MRNFCREKFSHITSIASTFRKLHTFEKNVLIWTFSFYAKKAKFLIILKNSSHIVFILNLKKKLSILEMILSIYLNSKGCWHLKIYLSNVCMSNIGWKGNKLQLFAQFALSRFLLCKHKYSNAQSRKRNYGLFLCRHTANSQG